MIACDLGSNTFRIVELECSGAKRLREFERVVKTAQGLSSSGKISKDAERRVIDAIDEAKEIFDLDSAYFVATAALRLASNKEEVLQNIKDATGIEFQVISSEDEAAYVRVGVENRLKLLNIEPKDYIILDLGGGSCEFILKEQYKSFNIGIVTIADKYRLEDIEIGVKEELKPVIEFSQKISRVKKFIASSGTPTTVAAFLQNIDYINYDYQKINGYLLQISDLDIALDRLLSMSMSDRVKWVGVGRDELIIAGILILKEIVKIFGFDKFTVIDDGLREGVAISHCP